MNGTIPQLLPDVPQVPAELERSVPEVQSVQQAVPQQLAPIVQQQQSSQIQSKEDFFKKLEQSEFKPGAMPVILATFAALSGNFGPAMMLHEQKRKTGVARTVNMGIDRANLQLNRGDRKGAEETLEKTLAMAGPRSPEVIPQINRLLERSAKLDIELRDADREIARYEEEVKQYKQNSGQEHPYAGQIRLLRKDNDMGIPTSKESLERFATRTKPEMQQYQGAMVHAWPNVAVMRTVPETAVVRAEGFDPWVIGMLGSELKMSPNDIVNFQNTKPGQPYMLNGVDVNTSENQAKVRERRAELDAYNAQRLLGKDIGIEPSVQAQMLAEQGPEAVAARTKEATSGTPIGPLSDMSQTQSTIQQQQGTTPVSPTTGQPMSFTQIQTSIKRAIVAEALKQGVDPALALSVAQQESSFYPQAKGDGGKSHGIFQLQPDASAEMGVDPRKRIDPRLNIPAGVGYLKKQILANKGNTQAGLTRYNGGGDPNYAANVMRHYEGNKQFITSQNMRAAQLGDDLPLTPTGIRAQVPGGVAVTTDKTGVGSAITGQIQRQTDAAVAQMDATQKASIGYPAIINLAAYHFDKNDPDSFLSSVNEPMSYNQTQATKGKIKLLNTDVVQKQLIPLQTAMSGLQLVDTMFNLLDNPNDAISRFGTAIQTRVSSYIGAATENMTVATAAKAVVERSLQEVGSAAVGSATPDSKAIADLVAYTTGGAANADAGRKAARLLQSRLRDRMGQYIGKDNLPVLEKYEAEKQEIVLPESVKPGPMPGTFVPRPKR